MEKFGIVESADPWSLLSLLRNKLAHEYHGNASKQAERLNEAYDSAPVLIRGVNRIKEYVMAKKLVDFSQTDQDYPTNKNP